jgi:preprotein translocase subunit SecG
MQSDSYHVLAKDAGNRLKGYILGYASGATGVFFLALADSNSTYTTPQKIFLVFAILFFVATIVICLYELHVDARRFFNVAKQLDLPKKKQSWTLNEHYKSLRVRLIYSSYVTVALATALSVSFLVARVT